MVASAIDYISACILPLACAAYLTFMTSLHKYRAKPPFNSCFFRLLFVLGVIDLLRSLEDWVLFRFATFGWFGVHRLVMRAPGITAKIHMIWSWYLGHAQIFGILWLALNRLFVIGHFHAWTQTQETLWTVVLLVLPVVTTAPLWGLEFKFWANGTEQEGVVLLWENQKWQHIYLATCGVGCCVVACASLLIYTTLFYRVWKNNKEVPGLHDSPSGRPKESYFLIIGLGLGVICGFCGCICAVMAYSSDPEMMKIALSYLNLCSDMLCWSNPFMVLVCSPTMRKHFKAVILCSDVNDVEPAN